ENIDKDNLEELAELIAEQIKELEPETIIELYNKSSAYTRHRPLTLKKNLSPDELARIEARKYELPGVIIETEPLRDYPYDEICSHIIGYLGFINDRELELEAYRTYARDDLVGRTGIEANYQTRLRGEDGLRQVVVNARGRELETFTVKPAASGNNLQLTIDIELQKFAFQEMAEKVGSLVAIDPRNGEILTMVSTPSFSNNLFSTRIRREDWQRINNDPLHPLQNRPIQGCYPPGSTIKPLIAAVALTDQLINENSKFFCNGSMTLGRTRFRCWNRYGHGETKLLKSLRESCDVYFYNLATRVSIDRIAAFGNEFGLGRKSDIELPGERSGLMPSSSWKLKNVHDQWYTGDTLSVCIGQGYLSTTPLQIAAMYTVFANGGTYFKPHLVKDKNILTDNNDRPENMLKKPDGTKIDISNRHMQAIRTALRQVVNNRRGTAYKSRITTKEWEMAGKTGTAQVVRQSLETLKDVTPWRFRDHAWFAAFAPFDNPRIAVAVLIEHGGHGGSTAAPIARQVIEFYLNQADTLKK
ncbi:MAG: penicillin-binding protein 2, partial [Deltaproteobacteria bacterium]|nr:penicillin-binding protein 2 [Deltaproteobacteria bacterium]